MTHRTVQCLPPPPASHQQHLPRRRAQPCPLRHSHCHPAHTQIPLAQFHRQLNPAQACRACMGYPSPVRWCQTAMMSRQSPALSKLPQIRCSSQQVPLQASNTPQRHQLRGWQAKKRASRQQTMLCSRSLVIWSPPSCQCKHCFRGRKMPLNRWQLYRASMAEWIAHLGLRWLGSSWTFLRYGSSCLGADACGCQMDDLLLSSCIGMAPLTVQC